MSNSKLREQIIACLQEIAPEIDISTVQDHRPLRETYDLDSADYLNFLIKLHERFAVSIPESDYSQLMTIASATRYLAQQLKHAP